MNASLYKNMFQYTQKYSSFYINVKKLVLGFVAYAILPILNSFPPKQIEFWIILQKRVCLLTRTITRQGGCLWQRTRGWEIHDLRSALKSYFAGLQQQGPPLLPARTWRKLSESQPPLNIAGFSQKY